MSQAPTIIAIVISGLTLLASVFGSAVKLAAMFASLQSDVRALAKSVDAMQAKITQVEGDVAVTSQRIVFLDSAIRHPLNGDGRKI